MKKNLSYKEKRINNEVNFIFIVNRSLDTIKMAKAKIEKKLPGIAMDLTECPKCTQTMSAPIYQCQSGHSLCHSCTKAHPWCCICNHPMTQMRNLILEEIIAKSHVPCRNKHLGCSFNLVSKDMDNHLKECKYHEINCPLGAVFGKCSWSGNVKGIMDHFKECHPQNCNINTDTEIEFDNISIQEDERFVYLVLHGNLLFIVTMKIDVLQNVVYWVVQHIGIKKTAQQHIYEIHITSKQDSRRKVIFIDHCFNDNITADGIYNLGKCAILPLKVFSQFILNKKFSFKFEIKRIPTGPKNKPENSGGENENKLPNKGFKGPKPAGPRNNHGFKSSGPNSGKLRNPNEGVAK